jgi:proteasome lid subunit RPN8/RPN11
VTAPQEALALSSVVMGAAVWEDLRVAGVDRAGLERCGVLVGGVADGVAYVTGCGELQHVAADPVHHYEFDPAQQAATWERAERWGYQVLGVWHTHPAGPEEPSETDLAYMTPWLLYPLVYPDGAGGAAMRVFVKTDTGWATLPYEVTPTTPEPTRPR